MFSLNVCSQETHDKKPSLMRVIRKKIAHDYNKIEMNWIIENDALCTHPVSAQRLIFNHIENIVTVNLYP